MTYIGGVTTGVTWDDDGVENELFAKFHRLARYPGVEGNDAPTPFGMEEETSST